MQKVVRVNDTAEFLLGWWLNQDGVRYCSVYSSLLPMENRKELQEDHNGIWDQVDFVDADYFIESMMKGSALPSDIFENHLQNAEEWRISAAETEAEIRE